jgi:pyruvate,water dikinase
LTRETATLLGLAGAIVAESGGVLSNAAILARECAIPAVFGVHQATHHIRDGERVTVDGTRGMITIE